MASHLIYDAIKAHIEGNWSLTGLDRFFWENEAQPPDGASMIVVEMQGTSYAQASIGADVQAENRWDEEGIVMFHCMVPRGSGARFSRQIAKAMADLFRGARLMSDSLEFRDAGIGVGGTLDNVEGKWWGVTVTIDWRRMEN